MVMTARCLAGILAKYVMAFILMCPTGSASPTPQDFISKGHPELYRTAEVNIGISTHVRPPSIRLFSRPFVFGHIFEVLVRFSSNHSWDWYKTWWWHSLWDSPTLKCVWLCSTKSTPRVITYFHLAPSEGRRSVKLFERYSKHRIYVLKSINSIFRITSIWTRYYCN